jgi:hypothetical protein
MFSLISKVVFNKNITKIIFYDDENNSIFNFEFNGLKYVDAFKKLTNFLNNAKENNINYDNIGIWTIGNFSDEINCEIDLLINNNKVTFVGIVKDFQNEFIKCNFTTKLNDSLVEVFKIISNYSYSELNEQEALNEEINEISDEEFNEE